MSNTSIGVSPKLKDALRKLKKYRQTFEDVIWELIKKCQSV